MLPSRARAFACLLLGAAGCAEDAPATAGPIQPEAAGMAGAIASVAGAETTGAVGALGGASGSLIGMGGGGVSGDAAAGLGGVVAGMTGSGGASAGAASDMPQGPVQHRFLSGISDAGPVALVAADGHIEWQYHVDGEANDAWLLPSGNVVFAHKSGARELTPENVVVWSYSAPSGAEVHSCQPLDGGHFLLGEAHDGGVGYLKEVDATGALQNTITIRAGSASSAHGQFREVRKTPQNTYLVTYLDFNKAREVDATGKLLREFPCGSFVAVRLPDQNTLIACGDAHRVIEVDPQNKIVWEVTEKEIPGNQLGFAAGVQRLPNGNTIICNWPGHGGLPPNQPQAFELTREKQVVWELRSPELKLVSNLEVLDSAVVSAAPPLR